MTFDTEEHEKAYFLRAACNEAKNVLKSFWRSHRMDYEDVPESMLAVTDPHPMAEDILRLLEPKYREVLVLFYVEGLTSAEIAELLSRNEIYKDVYTSQQEGKME
jgi:RNA polymerase sigma-70 factor (ECF subfamily)